MPLNTPVTQVQQQRDLTLSQLADELKVIAFLLGRGLETEDILKDDPLIYTFSIAVSRLAQTIYQARAGYLPFSLSVQLPQTYINLADPITAEDSRSLRVAKYDQLLASYHTRLTDYHDLGAILLYVEQ